jgi:hypothetical protein
VTVGIIVHGNNHFIVRGPQPSVSSAVELVRHWSLIQIGSETPPHLREWEISTREFREDLQWAIIVPAETSASAAVLELLAEMERRGIVLQYA